MTNFLAKWGAPNAGTGSGVVTWSFAQHQGNLTTFSNAITEGRFVDAVRRAFDTWERAANIDVQEIADTGSSTADIRLGWSYIDGRWGTVGETYWNASGGTFNKVEIAFDIEESWVYSQGSGSSGVNAYAVALHEIGHAIGLDHVADPTSIMNQTVSVGSPSANDLKTISYLYGARFPAGFEPLLYIASYGDLTRAFGANAAAGSDHWAQTGQFEGRQITFNALAYIASYTDLANVYGADQAAGVLHYLNNGWREGRTTSFDGLEYIASHSDLMSAFGTNAGVGTQHFINTGRFEGRQTTFDGLSYIASYGDLIRAFGTDASAGTTHWIATGHFEGRATSFDPMQYLAGCDDLVLALGPDANAAMQHWLQYGFQEGRGADDFDEAQYLANYTDLQAAYGTDLRAATDHYIRYGIREGRTDADLHHSGGVFLALGGEDVTFSNPDQFVM